MKLKAIGEKTEHYDEIREIFLKPEIADKYKLSWSKVNEAEVKELLCKEHNFSVERVENALKKFHASKEAQKSIEEWF